MGAMRSAALALLGSFLAALVVASAAPAAVESGTIRVNRGAVGITLGMKRHAVVDELGPPLYENSNGFMEYSEDNLFDLYLNGRNRVRLIGISGPDFCLASGICMFEKFGVRKLRNQFGNRLKEVEVGETGETILVVRGPLQRKARLHRVRPTTTLRGRGKIIMVFIGRCPPRAGRLRGLAALVAALLVDRALGQRVGLEPLIRDRLAALDR